MAGRTGMKDNWRLHFSEQSRLSQPCDICRGDSPTTFSLSYRSEVGEPARTIDWQKTRQSNFFARRRRNEVRPTVLRALVAASRSVNWSPGRPRCSDVPTGLQRAAPMTSRLRLAVSRTTRWPWRRLRLVEQARARPELRPGEPEFGYQDQRLQLRPL